MSVESEARAIMLNVLGDGDYIAPTVERGLYASNVSTEAVITAQNHSVAPEVVRGAPVVPHELPLATGVVALTGQMPR